MYTTYILLYITFIILIIIYLSILLHYHIVSQTPIELRNSSIHNRGVFAKRHIYKNEIIEIVPLLYIDNKEITNKKDNPNAKIIDYALFTTNKQYAIMLGMGSLYNHSDDNNAMWTQDTNIDDSIVIHAIKDINKDEEICVDYGKNYWNNRKDLVKKHV